MTRYSRIVAVLCLASSAFLIALPTHATLIEATFSLDLPDFDEPIFDPLEQLLADNSITQLTGTASWDTAVIASGCPPLVFPLISCSIGISAVEGAIFATNIDFLFDTSPQGVNVVATPAVPNGVLTQHGLNTAWEILIGGDSYSLSLDNINSIPRWKVGRVQSASSGCVRRECLSSDSLSVSGASIHYQAVPTPNSLTLFGIGLAGLGWLRRKQRF